MEYSIEDFLNVIILKSQLVNANTAALLKLYEEKDMYGLFLDTVNIMLDIDSGFLLLDEKFINKIEDIIASQRFNIKDTDYNNAANNIIININQIKNYSAEKKECILIAYQLYHEEIRKTDFDDIEDLATAIGYDALVNESLQNATDLDVENVYYFGSINYLKEAIPEIYDDDIYKERAINKLETILKKERFKPNGSSKNIKKTITEFQKIKVKKED